MLDRLMRIPVLIVFILSAICSGFGQQAVYFLAKDGLRVRGDLYVKDARFPFIILCHQDNSNRSEYFQIAPKLLNLNYNCLAIDLRAGDKTGFTDNETARQAAFENRHAEMLDATADIAAAIQYVQQINNQPVILFGSSYSASLCLIEAMDEPTVSATIAFSPGEFFQPKLCIGEELRKFNKQVFVGSTGKEYAYLKEMTVDIPPEKITLFKPEKGEGVHGAKALLEDNITSDEYWFALMMFFRKIK
jgi:hypothetical protein